MKTDIGLAFSIANAAKELATLETTHNHVASRSWFSDKEKYIVLDALRQIQRYQLDNINSLIVVAQKDGKL